MIEAATNSRPDWLSAPGETIADLLEEKGWSQVELSTRTGFTRKHINELVSGKAAITPDAALKLEAALGGTARFWLSREAQYREALARKRSEAELEAHSGWLSEIPVRDMQRFGWIAARTGKGARVAECLKFFGVASVAAWREKYERPFGAAFRSSAKVRSRIGAIAAWLRQGERMASACACADYDEDAFRSGLADLRALTSEPDPAAFVPRLLDTCARTGVVVVFVQAPKGCPVSGAARWLTPRRALIQLSLRYKSNDQLWFTLFHEAGHLVLHARKMLFLEGVEAIDDAREAEADAFARDLLIPPSAASTLPYLRSGDDVRRFASSLGIAPGIVVGRLQKEGLLPWNYLNALKVRYQFEAEKGA